MKRRVSQPTEVDWGANKNIKIAEDNTEAETVSPEFAGSSASSVLSI